MQPSPSTRRAWIEMVDFNKLKASGMSPSTRRAWIEIPTPAPVGPKYEIALHPEGVDRNYHLDKKGAGLPVALHPEGVDRNCR